MPSWWDWEIAFGIAEALGALALLGLTITTVRISRGGLDAAKRSADEARRSADAAKVSADAALRQVAEENAARKDATLPVLDMILDDIEGVPETGPTARVAAQPDPNGASYEDTVTLPFRRFSVDLVNHGLGPAVFLRVDWHPAGRKPEQAIDTFGVVAGCEMVSDPAVQTLGAGQCLTLRFATPWIPDAYMNRMSEPPHPQGRVAWLGEIKARYKDVLGRPGSVGREVRLSSVLGRAVLEIRSTEEDAYAPPGDWRDPEGDGWEDGADA